MNIKKLNWFWGGGSSSVAPSVNDEYDGVISHWSLNNHGLDYFAGINNANAYNNSTWVSSIVPNISGVGLEQVSGPNRYITIAPLDLPDGDNTAFDGGSPDLPFSFSFWMYPKSNAALKYIISKQESATKAEYEVFRNTTGTIGFIIYSGGDTTTNYLYARSVGTTTINTLSFITVTYDGSGVIGGLNIYINGTIQTISDQSIGSYVSQLHQSNTGLYIGSKGSSHVTANNFIGTLQSITLFNKVLDQAQVTALYNSGNGVAFVYSFNDGITPYYESAMVVFATRGDYQFATTWGSTARYLYWSDDCGITWKNIYDWGVMYSGSTPLAATTITMAYIFSDGTLIFSTSNKIYRSTNKLVTITDITATNVFEADGVTPYTFHTPANASYPGAYFGAIGYDSRHNQISGNDIFVWTSYCNTALGASPINVWYTIDKGVTIKTLYTFGQNPYERDNGTADGGSTGTLLGDSGNSLITRHGHNCVRDPDSNDWYSCFGDTDSINEVHWLKHTYTPGSDSWSTSIIAQDKGDGTKWKSIIGGIYNGEVYFGSDATAGTEPELGVFKTTFANIGVSATRIIDTDSNLVSGLYVGDNGNMVITHAHPDPLRDSIRIASGFGSNNTVYPINEVADIYFVGIHPPDSRGYVKIGTGNIAGYGKRTIFVKV